MARIKRAVNAVKKRRKIFRLSKGYYGAKNHQYRGASQQVMKSMAYAYVGRKLKKREYRQLWIARINAGARMCGISYSRLINGLKLADVEINRKVLADLAVADMPAFEQLVATAKKALDKPAKKPAKKAAAKKAEPAVEAVAEVAAEGTEA